MLNNPESDAGGYRGDWSRGAPLGRPNLNGGFDAIEGAPPFVLRKVRLDSGGYDQGGAYWGVGVPLYYYEGPISDISGYVRGRTREIAKSEVRKLHKHARFFR